jgi:hypothetical protein
MRPQLSVKTSVERCGNRGSLHQEGMSLIQKREGRGTENERTLASHRKRLAVLLLTVSSILRRDSRISMHLEKNGRELKRCKCPFQN